MKRRTLLHNLFSSMLALPVAGAYATKTFALEHFTIPNTFIEPDDESQMRRAIRLAGNVPKYPFGALLVDQQGVVVAEGWNRSVNNPSDSALYPRIDRSGMIFDVPDGK